MLIVGNIHGDKPFCELLQCLLDVFRRTTARQEMHVLPPRHLARIKKRRRGKRLVGGPDVGKLLVGVGGVYGIHDLQPNAVADDLLRGLGYAKVILAYYDMNVQ